MAIQHINKEYEDREVDMRTLKGRRPRRKISKVRAPVIEKRVDDFGFSLVEAGRP